jgi:hypothetical protein
VPNSSSILRNPETPTASNADSHVFLSVNGVAAALTARVRDVLTGEGDQVLS